MEIKERHKKETSKNIFIYLAGLILLVSGIYRYVIEYKDLSEAVIFIIMGLSIIFAGYILDYIMKFKYDCIFEINEIKKKFEILKSETNSEINKVKSSFEYVEEKVMEKVDEKKVEEIDLTKKEVTIDTGEVK